MGRFSKGVASKGQLELLQRILAKERQPKKKKTSVIEFREMFGFILEVYVIHPLTFDNHH
jgi:hypothetical protein